jgi:hypothetical protein
MSLSPLGAIYLNSPLLSTYWKKPAPLQCLLPHFCKVHFNIILRYTQNILRWFHTCRFFRPQLDCIWNSRLTPASYIPCPSLPPSFRLCNIISKSETGSKSKISGERNLPLETSLAAPLLWRILHSHMKPIYGRPNHTTGYMFLIK